MNIEKHILKSNGIFGIIKEPFDKKQHCNQQGGLDRYVEVLRFQTGHINIVKLYHNRKGLHFKAAGSTNYLNDFTDKVTYIPYQILEEGKQ